MAATLSDDDHARLSEAIGRAEENTAGEIFVVVARASDDYRFLPPLFAALATIAGAFIAALIFPQMSALALAFQELGAFVLLLAVGSIRGVRRRLVPKSVMARRARRNAMEQFLAQNLHATEERTGVLIFVSLFERHAEIVADKAINDRAPAGTWERIIGALTARIGEGDLAGGLEQAIGSAGEILAAHFPPSAFDRNELPDSVIEL